MQTDYIEFDGNGGNINPMTVEILCKLGDCQQEKRKFNYADVCNFKGGYDTVQTAEYIPLRTKRGK
jgi:hypothetical protein